MYAIRSYYANFYQPIEYQEIDSFKDVWNQEFVTENQSVKKIEYIAWNVFLKNPDVGTEKTNRAAIEEFFANHFGEGLVKGVHDEDVITSYSIHYTKLYEQMRRKV